MKNRTIAHPPHNITHSLREWLCEIMGEVVFFRRAKLYCVILYDWSYVWNVVHLKVSYKRIIYVIPFTIEELDKNNRFYLIDRVIEVFSEWSGE